MSAVVIWGLSFPEVARLLILGALHLVLPSRDTLLDVQADIMRGHGSLVLRSELLSYGQWPDPLGTVTFASVAFEEAAGG